MSKIVEINLMGRLLRGVDRAKLLHGSSIAEGDYWLTELTENTATALRSWLIWENAETEEAGEKADSDLMTLLAQVWRALHALLASKKYREPDALATDLILAEYAKAVAKHGDRTFDNSMPTSDRFAALLEEIGEVSRAMTHDAEHAGEILIELAQVGELVAAMILHVRKKVAALPREDED